MTRPAAAGQGNGGGLLKAVDVAGVRFYYRDPVEAADVILGSVDLSILPRAEREKLMRL